MSAAPAPKRLCLCVDDLGLHAGVRAAVIDLVGQGRVHAVGCMVGAPDWPHAAVEARAMTGVDLGLHLDLTEHPLTRPASPLAALIRGCMARRESAPQLRAEVSAQLDRFEADVGRLPDYIDGHQHVHQLPQVREALAEALRDAWGRRPGPAPWLRNTRGPWLPSAGVAQAAKGWLIGALGAAGLQRLARRHAWPQNHRLLGVYDFQPGTDYAALLPRWLAGARDGDLLMCHPSRPADAPSDLILPARLAEFAVLSSPDLPGWLAAQGLVLQRMSHILAGPGSAA